MDVLGRPGFGTRNQPHGVYKGFSLFHVFETMAPISAHRTRMSICNSERKVVGLITQSMIISLFDQHLDRLGTLATNHTVNEMIPGLFEDVSRQEHHRCTASSITNPPLIHLSLTW
jgi:hypothetical protein